MGDAGDQNGARRDKEPLIDVTVPNAMRAADFLDGGKNNFAADREAVRAIMASAPAIERIPAEARAFRHRVIKYLVTEARVRQFLVIGTGMVPPGTTHEVAQAMDPECRVVYIDNDPVVLSRAQTVISSARPGTVTWVGGDIAKVDAIVANALPVLDVSEPVAILVSALVHLPTTAAAAQAVSTLMAAVSSGSYTVLHHMANDLDPAMPAALRHWNKTASTPMTLRSRADIHSFVAGLELVAPGVVPVTEWRPEGTPAPQVPVHGVVARKP